MFQTVAEDELFDAFAPPNPSPVRGPLASRADCLEQLLGAFNDIADLDDIHQAAQRLALVQEWLRREVACAAADPLFAD
jgi:hypothetical protein